MSGWFGEDGDERAISPVVGVALLVAIAVILVAITGAILFGIAEDKPPAPQARLAVTPDATGCGFTFQHRGGDRIRGKNLEVEGLHDPNALDGEILEATDEVGITPQEKDLTVIWHAPEEDIDHVLANFEVNTSISGGWACSSGTVLTEDSDKLKVVAGNGSNDIQLTNPSNIEALGPASLDLTDDGITDVPYVTTNGKIKITNETNQTTTIADSSSGVIDGNIARQKTRLAVGEWNGSDPSVFFVDDNDNKIYRVPPGGSPQVVANPSNGANSVLAVANVDGDGDDELVFADGSQALRYVDPGDGIEKMKNAGTGSNNGIGSGSVADFDGDGKHVFVAVGGSNEIKLIGAKASENGEGTESIPTGTAKAKKAPATVADVDADGEDEIVYVGNDDGKVKYIDDVDGARNVKFLRDEDGNKVDGSDETGIL